MKKNTVVKFDATKCDILAVYLIDIDKVFYLDAGQFHDTSTVALKPGDSRFLDL